MIALAAFRAFSALRDQRNLPQVRLLGAAVFACLMAQYVNGLFVDTTHWRHMFVLIGIGASFPVTVRVRF
jgi:hypothetical protein